MPMIDAPMGTTTGSITSTVIPQGFDVRICWQLMIAHDLGEIKELMDTK